MQTKLMFSLNGVGRGWSWAVVFLCWVGWLHAAGPEIPGVDEKWRHYASPNFELYSRANDVDSREVLYKLELVRHLFGAEMKFAERDRTPVTVFYFGKTKTFKAHLPESMQKGDFAGLYSADPDRARILISPEISSDDLQAVVFHEYIHHMVRSSQYQLPPWLNEGLAEMYGSLQINGKYVEFGRPSEGRLYELGRSELMPLERLFAVDESSPIYLNGKHNGAFYAQSWALMHFWFYGDNKLPAGAAKNFVSWVARNRGANSEEIRAAFEGTFGVTMKEMASRLESYSRSGRYRWIERPLPSLPESSTYTRREVPTEEIRWQLSSLALLVRDSGLAKYELIELAQKKTPNPEIYEVLGARAVMDNDPQTALEYWNTALALGSSNPAIVRRQLRLEMASWFNGFDPSNEIAPAKREEMRARVNQSLEKDPGQAVGYELLVWLEAFSRKPDWNTVKLVQNNFSKVSEPEQVLLAVAVAAWKLGDIKQTKAILAKIGTMDPDSWTQRSAEVLLARIEKRRPDFDKVVPPRREQRIRYRGL